MQPSSTTRTTNAELQLALNAVRSCIAAQDYESANQYLAACSRIVAEVLPSMEDEHRRDALASILTMLEWAQGAVKAGREHTRNDLSQLIERKVYRMPDPAERTHWKIEG